MVGPRGARVLALRSRRLWLAARSVCASDVVAPRLPPSAWRGIPLLSMGPLHDHQSTNGLHSIDISTTKTKHSTMRTRFGFPNGRDGLDNLDARAIQVLAGVADEDDFDHFEVDRFDERLYRRFKADEHVSAIIDDFDAAEGTSDESEKALEHARAVAEKHGFSTDVEIEWYPSGDPYISVTQGSTSENPEQHIERCRAAGIA